MSKLLIREKEITTTTLDVSVNNNYWPARVIKSRFDLYKDKQKDMMRDFNKKLKPLNDEAEHKDASQ